MSQDDNCTFCDIIRGAHAAEILIETDEYICFLDKYPVNEGHALVVPKTHIQYLREANGSRLYGFVERAIEEVRRRFEPEGVNIGLNDGPAAGQTIPHLHWHVIPRYTGDMGPPGGVRGVIPSEQTY